MVRIGSLIEVVVLGDGGKLGFAWVLGYTHKQEVRIFKLELQSDLDVHFAMVYCFDCHVLMGYIKKRQLSAFFVTLGDSS